MAMPRSIKGFTTKIEEAQAELDQLNNLLASTNEDDEGYSDIISRVATAEVELKTLQNGLADLESAGSASGQSDDTDQSASDQSDDAAANAEAESMLAESTKPKYPETAFIRCAGASNRMVNPFNPNVSFVGHSATQTKIDKWTASQLDAGILVIVS